jgi:hypothetical protein
MTLVDSGDHMFHHLLCLQAFYTTTTSKLQHSDIPYTTQHLLQHLYNLIHRICLAQVVVPVVAAVEALLPGLPFPKDKSRHQLRLALLQPLHTLLRLLRHRLSKDPLVQVCLVRWPALLRKLPLLRSNPCILLSTG